MTTPTPSVCLITCPVCGTEGATSNEAAINKELFQLRRDLAAAQSELVKVKAENSKLRSALEIVHFKREQWQ